MKIKFSWIKKAISVLILIFILKILITAFFYFLAAGVIVSSSPATIPVASGSPLGNWEVVADKGWLAGKAKVDLTQPVDLPKKGLDVFDYDVFAQIEKPAGRNLYVRLNRGNWKKISQDTALKIPFKVGRLRHVGEISISFYADSNEGKNFYGDQVTLSDFVVKEIISLENLRKIEGKIEEWTFNNIKGDPGFLIFYGLILILTTFGFVIVA